MLPQKIGRHQLIAEQNVLLITFDGDFSLEDADIMGKAMMNVANEYGAVYSVSWLNKLGKVPPETRKFMGTHPVTPFWRGTAVIGASLPFRILVKLVLQGMRLLSKSEVQMAFFESEAAARTWIMALRARDSAAMYKSVSQGP